MDETNLPIPARDTTEHIQPEELVQGFQKQTSRLDARLDSLQELIQQIRAELHDESSQALSQLAQAARDMANGQVYQRIDLQAKGELGALAQSLNQTLQNLQQLDASVKHQSTQVPELASQLDAITQDTENATQSVMNRLDTLMSLVEFVAKSLELAERSLQDNQEANARFQAQIDLFLDRASAGENPALVAQEILEFLFEQRMTSKLMPVELRQARKDVASVSDECFEILNTLQFQDITRQKVEKVVLLLKQFQAGLQRLLAIFNIYDEANPKGEIFEHRQIATQEHIFETTLEADRKKQSVEDIIAQFKKGQG